MSGDTEREATSTEVTSLRKENEQLKAALAESILKTRVLKNNHERTSRSPLYAETRTTINLH